VTTFGDFDDDDAFDTADPDPEQVARKIAALEGLAWSNVPDEWRAARIAAAARLLAWLRRQGGLT